MWNKNSTECACGDGEKNIVDKNDTQTPVIYKRTLTAHTEQQQQKNKSDYTSDKAREITTLINLQQQQRMG